MRVAMKEEGQKAGSINLLHLWSSILTLPIFLGSSLLFQEKRRKEGQQPPLV